MTALHRAITATRDALTSVWGFLGLLVICFWLSKALREDPRE